MNKKPFINATAASDKRFTIQYTKGERHDFTLKLKKQFTSASLNDRFTGWM